MIKASIEYMREHCETPWNAGSWDGKVTVLDDGLSSAIPAASDVVEVIASDGYAGSHGDYDRYSAIVRLSDGRFLGWESWSDVTGSGFHSDAYGGDAEVFVSADAEKLFARLPELKKP